MTLETSVDDHGAFDFGDDDADAFYKNLTGASEAAEKPVEGDESDAGTPDAPEGAEAAGEAPEGSETPAGEDDAEIEFKEGDETRKVKLADVKRLLAAEKDITDKSSAIAAETARVTAVTTKATEVLGKALERAKERLAPYAELNLLVLSKTLDDATLIQVQKDMKAAEDEVRFYESQIAGVTTEYQQVMGQAQVAAAQNAIKVLSNPSDPRHIPNFDQKLYGDMVEFATKTGMDRSAVLNITDPGAIKLLHMAMQYAQGAKAAEAKVKPVVNKPTKVLRPAASSASAGKSDAKTSAIAKLRRSGSEDDAVDAFLASLTSA